MQRIFTGSGRPDGLDLSGCEDVLIEGCVVASDDDCIVITSNSAERVNPNIRVVNNGDVAAGPAVAG